MQILWIVCLSLLLVYILWLLSLLAGWYRSLRRDGKDASRPPDEEKGALIPAVSIVIPVRNEEANLPLLAGDLLKQDYPPGSLEILIVDDHSEDRTVDIVLGLREGHPGIRLISLGKEQGKNAALLKGVENASNGIILFTDGDCRAGPGWVAGMTAGFSDPGLRMVVGGLIIEPDRMVFHAMQSLELFSITSVTAGSAGLGKPVLCSGANLACYREDYLEFSAKEEKVSESGDDVFLMLWLKRKYPGSVRYSASDTSVIRTAPAPDPGSFIRQRLRWASKSLHYRDAGIIGTALLVFAVNALLSAVLLVLLLALLPGTRLPGPTELLLLFGVLLAGKAVADLILLFPVLKQYSKTHLLGFFLPLEIVYFMYVSLTGILGPFLPMLWKGRTVPAIQRNTFLGSG
jgi:cellulose synthase/poly-beta-1,6-N-acetylglucosamine synthase-like glycosyltransferase